MVHPTDRTGDIRTDDIRTDDIRADGVRSDDIVPMLLGAIEAAGASLDAPHALEAVLMGAVRGLGRSAFEVFEDKGPGISALALAIEGARDAVAGGGLGDAFGFDERRLARALVLFGPHHGADDGAEPVSDRPATGGHTATIEEFIALRDQVEAAAAAILVSSGGVVRVKDPDAVLRSMAAFRVAGASMIGSLLLMAHRMPGFGLGDDEFIKGLAVDLGAGFACAERGRRK